jgi:hypothetical protein
MSTHQRLIGICSFRAVGACSDGWDCSSGDGAGLSSETPPCRHGLWARREPMAAGGLCQRSGGLERGPEGWGDACRGSDCLFAGVWTFCRVGFVSDFIANFVEPDQLNRAIQFTRVGTDVLTPTTQGVRQDPQGSRSRIWPEPVAFGTLSQTRSETLETWPQLRRSEVWDEVWDEVTRPTGSPGISLPLRDIATPSRLRRVARFCHP